MLLTDIFLQRSENRKRIGNEVRVCTDYPHLYKFFLNNHVLPCLKDGGEIVIAFGDEVKEVFKEPIMRANAIKTLQPDIPLRHNGTQLDVEIWVLSGNLILLTANYRKVPNISASHHLRTPSRKYYIVQRLGSPKGSEIGM